MKSLIRKEFINQIWDANDLDAAGEFWLRLYEKAASSRGFSPTPDHCIEIRLSGFPTASGEDVQRELTNRYASSDFQDLTVELLQPDLVVVRSRPASGETAPPVGLGLPRLAGPPFDGLLAEIRFTALGHEGRFFKSATVSLSLVIIGELRGGALHVKAVCKSGSSVWEDEALWLGKTTDESQLLAGLVDFKEGGTIPDGLARQLSKTVDNRSGQLWATIVCPPLGKPRLVGLLLRGFFFLIALTLFGFIFYLCSDNKGSKGLFLLFALLLIASGTGAILTLWLVYEARILFTYRAIRSHIDGNYAESVHFAALTPHESSTLIDDPTVRKYTAELGATGLVFVGDVAKPPASEAEVVYRIFRIPNGVTYLVMLCIRGTWTLPKTRVRIWPAAITFQAQTFFRAGGRVDSMSGDSLGYMKSPPTPNTLLRICRCVTDPLEFLQLHQTAVDAFASERGLTPQTHESFDKYIRRQEEIQAEEREWYRDHPYSWVDHLRWYLQMPRKEQRS